MSLVCPIPAVHGNKGQTRINSGLDEKVVPALECFNPDKRAFQKIPLQSGDMVLMASLDMSLISRRWILPCAHRVVTGANQPERLSFVCHTTIKEPNYGGRQEVSLDDLNRQQGRPCGIPLEVQNCINDKSLWIEAEEQVQKGELIWLQEETSIQQQEYSRLVDFMYEEDEDPMFIDLDDKPRDWSRK